MSSEVKKKVKRPQAVKAGRKSAPLRLPALKFNAQGLIPAVIQDRRTKEVLMVAYMSRESLKITIKEGRTCFWSRSRRTLWRKGETSGHIQKVKEVSYDCDKDALLIRVDQAGAACHTGNTSCFYRKINLK